MGFVFLPTYQVYDSIDNPSPRRPDRETLSIISREKVGHLSVCQPNTHPNRHTHKNTKSIKTFTPLIEIELENFTSCPLRHKKPPGGWSKAELFSYLTSGKELWGKKKRQVIRQYETHGRRHTSWSKREITLKLSRAEVNMSGRNISNADANDRVSKASSGFCVSVCGQKNGL